MRTVLVTGGAGFIGSHLVDRLLDGGASVRVLDNLSTGSLQNLQEAAQGHSRGGWAGVSNGSRLEVIIGDVRDRGLLRKALRNVKYVFHLAALPPSFVSVTDPRESHEVNVEGTLNVLHGALMEGVWRVVFGSCASVYGRPDTVPISEDAPVRPATFFAASKVAAETYCSAFHARHQLDTVTLRYFSVYGPRQGPGAHGGLVPILLDSVRRRLPVVEQDDRRIEDLTYVDDAVAATMAAAWAPRAAGRIINVGSGQMTAISDILSALTNLLQVPPVPALARNPDREPSCSYAHTGVAAELLDFAPRVSLIAGLARMLQFTADAERLEQAPFAPVGLDD